MRFSSHLISLLISLFCINAIYSQDKSSHRASKVIQRIAKALEDCDPCHYNAQMRFKDMSSDTFEVRKFNISSRSNPANPLYGYDWEISEELDSGYLYTFMILQNDLYVIYEGNKIIAQSPLPKSIDLGSITEYLRFSLILDEVVNPFTSVSPNEIELKDSAGYYYLTSVMSDIEIRELVVSKSTYLPVQSTSVIKDGEFDFKQVEEINYFYGNHPKTLPDTAFSPEHYISIGYSSPPKKSSTSNEVVDYFSSAESIEFLLYYPLVTPSGDTISLMASDAQYMLLDFWYASCMPCLKALPVINQLAAAYENDGLQVIGINCFDLANKEKVVKGIREKNISIPLYFGSRDLTDTLHINSFPSYVLITPERQVKFIHGSTEEVKKVLEVLFEK